MAEALVLGFGGRAPKDVLDILSRVGIGKIVPQRSQKIETHLLSAPHRTFLQNSCKGKGSLLIYCIPPSISEYIRFNEEACEVRSKLVAVDERNVVAFYDTRMEKILGGSVHDVLLAVGGDNLARTNLSSAGLTALANIDNEVAKHITKKDENTIIVVGSGGREHALAVALAKSPLVDKVICCPGNGGTEKEGGKIINKGLGQDNQTVIAMVKDTSAGMVVVGPEAPLVDGLVDELKESCPGVRAFGPSKAAAELEASKAFTKDFLEQHGIPTAKYRNFTDVEEALGYVNSLSDNDRQVVKASGLAAGKGVLLPSNKKETLDAVREIMADKAFGDAGDTCVIESFLTGPEASCLAFCDGKTAVLMPAAQDHKRALDNDEGLNTGGMGAYAPAPCVTQLMQEEIEIMCKKTVEEMAKRGTPYVGVLYAGMMLTPDGPYVLEFNCRFGDPETQVVLPLLETDLYEVFKACCDGTLDKIDIRFREATHAATVVCASKGYPEKYPKGMEITGIDETSSVDGVKVYHAGTKVDENGVIRCNGGRVLAVTGLSDTLKNATQLAYQGVRLLDFKDSSSGESLLHHRNDIAKRALSRKLRIGVLGSTRGTALIPLLEKCNEGSIPVEVTAVISNRKPALILEKGRSLGVGVKTVFISAKDLTREQYDAECTSVLLRSGVDLVILVGYMRILSKSFCDFWANRCINVHPSLLPKHAGGMDMEVHQAVIDAKEKESGCTIHYVTEEIDSGPIVVQKVVKVDENETPESLKAKVQAQEGIAYIEAILKHSTGEVMSYASAGVDIEAGNELVDLIKPACKATRRNGCDADLGGFGGLFDLQAANYGGKDTVLIGATDGVGTKLKIAQIVKKHKWVGIDLVAMCVNDLIVAGGEPLFFLDYFATGKLEVAQAAEVVCGIAEGCKLAGCGLIGGETAEMPSMYAPGEYDLAGFAVGAVKRGNILPKVVAVGDILIGLTSSGVHSNGFSLVRKLVEKEGLSYDQKCPWDSTATSIGDSLLTPTKIYVSCCLPLLAKGLLKGMAHITGGGLIENLPRSLPKGLGAKINGHPTLPNIFKWLQKSSGLSDTEMLRTFNCGIGMVLIVAPENVSKVKEILLFEGEEGVYDFGIVVDEEGVSVEGNLL
mmetsp:Transcript_2158/g.3202  ORF Transcript_2158/g.3202 Transcript_2158/m.3202 type:complete len:1128 (-) Transcript_2158:109-3492(-)|eukprot:CAMPEP_0194212570 /NCGR_PEP_ID=MMETSP0156-20130528/12597_1 /TAXON_ID=33649 /ORGANISM="Thalassionema nitzschioides, Strain L26-B" /LENGTH=1127 /DNA_ID=CAMNT_0038940429 /DNA_START=93 /DNA_END=3476 /DNA_ORIENTATION=-